MTTAPPPHDQGLEQALVGSCLLDEHVVDDVEALVRPEDCYGERNRALAIVRGLLKRDNVGLPDGLRMLARKYMRDEGSGEAS